MPSSKSRDAINSRSSREQRTAEKFADLDRRKKRLRKYQSARIGALNKVFRHRYGGEFYEFTPDDAGREDLHILIDHYASSNPLAIPRVIKMRAPWLTNAERENILDIVARFPRRWTSPALAGALNLTERERDAIGGVRTIAACDVTPAERKEKRRESDRNRKERKRRAAKMQPREQWLATNSKSRTKPWEKAGVSRATYYRNLKNDRETGLSAKKLVNTLDTPVSTSAQSQQCTSSDPVPHNQGKIVRLDRATACQEGTLDCRPTTWNDQHQRKEAA